MVLPAGKKIPRHQAASAITVQCLEGAIKFESHGRTQFMRSGTMLFLVPAKPHALEALENSSVLVSRLARSQSQCCLRGGSTIGIPMARSARPVFLNLTQIQMPVGALTSIGHRVSGIVLAASVPVGVYLLDRSLRNEQGFAEVTDLLRHGAVKVALVLVVWALAHHMLAGVRHMLSDFEVGSPLRPARRSAWFVNLGGVALALFAAVVLL